MKRLSNSGLNIDGASGGFSEGQVRDNPGDNTGTGAVKAWLQDPIYTGYAFIKKYLPGGVASDTFESETASDVMNSAEYMSGIKNGNVAEYENTTVYAQDDHVMYLGAQFVSMVGANIGNDPIDSSDKWLPCYERNEALMKFQKGDDIDGGFDILHNYRDAGYRQNFAWGKYNYGGDAGRNFAANGVHLDGSVVTGNTVLEDDIFKVGTADEYSKIDIIAPDELGTRTLIDTRARVARVVDAVAGLTEDVGGVDEDAAQTIEGVIANSFLTNPGTASGCFSSSAGSANNKATGAGNTYEIAFDNSLSTSPNAAKTNDLETKVKSYSVGVKAIFVLNEI